jgi:hypothetical protein
MKITNEKGYTPNVLHFHGCNINQLQKTFFTIFEKHIVNNDYDKSRLKIVSTWTNAESCWLYRQCEKNNIDLVNCVPVNYDKNQTWYMPNKIKYFIDILENSNEEIVLFLDGYDVLLTHLDDIIERFENQPYRILFGPSCNNYPNVEIDKIYNRSNMGAYRYFNAGCVIGYREDLLKFYREAWNYNWVNNPWNSEQLIMRVAFSKYSSDKNQTFVGIDYKCVIFQSMGILDSTFNADSVSFAVNRKPIINVLIVGDDDALNYFDNEKYAIFINKSKSNNYDLLDEIFEKRSINYVIYQLNKNDNIEMISKLCALYDVICFYVCGDDDFDYSNYKSKFNVFVKNSTMHNVFNNIK